MASTSTQRTTLSSSSTPRRRYDAFLSFYGKDTRKNFTDHLYSALTQKGINVFRDDEKLERGKYVIEELLKAISESMFAIVVISANYASSTSCLIELAKIVKCMKDTKLTVLPIFYHVDPFIVRNQKETFAKAFATHEASSRKNNPKFDMNTTQKWKAALKEVGKISGWHVHDRHESKIVKEICGRILRGLSRNFPNVSKFLVGINSRVEEIMSLLSKGGDAVHFLAIYGMGGIGKTTLSKVIYDRVSEQFEASCFIENIREQTKTHGLIHLQKQLICAILGEKKKNIWSEYEASKMIANIVRNKKVFIVLDDADEEQQLEGLAGSHDWFGQGSKIIVTSRDCHLPKILYDNNETMQQRSLFSTFEVKVLNYAEALELFSWKAFKKPYPEENYVKLSKDIVNYAQGLPLALEVFGSSVFGRTMDAWKSARDLLKTTPNSKILDKLKISFDGLADLEKELFLDIACYFNGAIVESIIHKLESLGYYPKFTIEVLVDKSLISISWGRFWMHDMLRKMGKKIIDDKSEELGERSRLWRYKDVLHVLKNNTGTDAVKGIVLELPLQRQERLNVEAFSKMKKLKMLQIHGTCGFGRRGCSKVLDNLRTLEWHGDPSNLMLSNELCVMEWWGYPFESLPTSFQSDKLVELIMHYSYVKQPWNGWKSFGNLKRIALSCSKNLIETPDFSGVPNLEELMLDNCTSLSKLHPSIELLRGLKRLYLEGCKRITRLPDEICLASVQYLNLYDCSRLNKFPDSVDKMTSLRQLYLGNTAIKELPLSLKGLSSLESLDLSGCSRLKKIPKNLISGMGCLQSLCVAGSAIRKFPLGSGSDLISLLIPTSFSCLSSLINLDLTYCNLSGGAIPGDFSCVSSLIDLNLSGNKFTRIPDSVRQLSNLIKLDLSYCNLLDGAIPNNLSCLSSLWSLNLRGNKFTRTPDSVRQLSRLHKLNLADCSSLQVLPKLPLGLTQLCVRKCPSLELFYNQMDMRTSSNKKLRSIDCSFVASYFDYDGKPYKILHLHPRSPAWTSKTASFDSNIACGPALRSGIPECFNDKGSANSSGTIQIHIDLDLDLGYDSDEWRGLALFIVYQVHEPDIKPKKRRQRKVHEHVNSNARTFDVSKPNFPYFVCQFQANEVDLGEPLVLCAPGVPSVGPSGFWVYIPAQWFWCRVIRGARNSSFEASITTCSLNVEVKECGACVVRHHNASEFYQVLNSISPRGLDIKSFDLLIGWQSLSVYGPIKSNVVASGSIGSVNGQDLLKKKKKKRSKICRIGNSFLMGI